MFGGAIPDLATTPCPACERTIDPHDVVWDPYHRGDRQLSALPYHSGCIADLLPPAEPTEAMRACAICAEAFDAATLAEAFAGLHQRFRQAKPIIATPQLVWRLAGREPRIFLAEHFSCLLGKV